MGRGRAKSGAIFHLQKTLMIVQTSANQMKNIQESNTDEAGGEPNIAKQFLHSFAESRYAKWFIPLLLAQEEDN